MNRSDTTPGWSPPEADGQSCLRPGDPKLRERRH
jgi:hypothetical protein